MDITNDFELTKELDKKYCKEIIGVLDDIYNDLQNNLFTKKELEEFLGGDDNSEKVIKKLGLIKIIQLLNN